ncbi:helix-turn-helix transcriptional regulator [Streptomyces sp. NPDC002580]|uniref:helix-turn-helix transcriptional regulator n=1 Tax=Streptomyces sp. NPDC002580 TaxID=3364653 RepID=UPI00368473BB
MAQHVLLGRSTGEITTRPDMSGCTVQDHLKEIFDKVGVRSRPELVAELFLRHHLPRLARPPQATDGRPFSGERPPGPA